MARINDREEFIVYIMNKLGYPIVTVNVTEEQVNYAIDDALLKFFEFHNEGSYRFFFLHEMTVDDVAKGQIKLPDRVLSVQRIYPIDGSLFISNNLASQSTAQTMFSGMYGGVGGAAAAYRTGTGMFSGGFGIGGGSGSGMGIMKDGLMSSAYLTQSYLGTISGMASSEHQFQFDKHASILYIDDKSLGVGIGGKILIELYMEVDENNSTVWDSIWLRDYATMLSMRQWGYNLMKLGNTQLANGTTINGQDILNEANNRITQLDSELEDKWGEPLGVYMG